MTFTDDADNDESLTSEATAAGPPPLPATIHDTPGSHDGRFVGSVADLTSRLADDTPPVKFPSAQERLFCVVSA